MRSGWYSIVALTLLSLALACGGTTWTSDDTSNAPRSHVMIQFTQYDVMPETARVTSGGTVSWNTDTGAMAGAVVISNDVATRLGCKRWDPDFSKTGDGYQSIPIKNGDDDLPLPCAVPKGSYDYTIVLYDIGGEAGGQYNPQSSLSGHIVAE